MNFKLLKSKIKTFLGIYIFPNKIENKGERVDIDLNKNISFNNFDIYQKSHYKRYEFIISQLSKTDSVGDFACGTGYGSVMISKIANNVLGIDINNEVINEISNRYKAISNVSFLNLNLLELDYTDKFDKIVSFETIEHFNETNIIQLLKLYNKALKQNGKIIFSTPYMQVESEKAIKMGFHLTFDINETKIESWLKQTGFQLLEYKYQNYNDFELKNDLTIKEFVICIAIKI